MRPATWRNPWKILLAVSFALVFVAVSITVAVVMTPVPTSNDSCLFDHLVIAETTPTHWDVEVRTNCPDKMDVTRTRWLLLRDGQNVQSGNVSDLNVEGLTFINMVGSPNVIDNSDVFRIARTAAQPGDEFHLNHLGLTLPN